MQFVSDIYTSIGGHLMVEWEFAGGGRWRQQFETEEERDKALRYNEKYLESHKEEVQKYLNEEAEWLAEMEKKYGV